MAERSMTKYRKRLLADKARLEQHRAKLRKNVAEQLEAATPDAADVQRGQHGDAGTEIVEREKHRALDRNVEDMLSQILEALDRIDKGRYGLCDACGKEISDARLQAVPYATLCIQCQSRMEAK